MSDDLNKKIKQITDILGQEKLPDNVQNLLNILTSAVNSEDAPAKSNENHSHREEPQERLIDENTEIPNKNRKTSDRTGSHHDPRVNLLMALKPFMSSKRQARIGHCIRVLTLSRLTSLMDDHED